MATIQNFNVTVSEGNGASDKMGNNYPPSGLVFASPFIMGVYPAIDWRIKSVTLDGQAVADAIAPTGNQTFSFPQKLAKTFYIVIAFEPIPTEPPSQNVREIEVSLGSKICYEILPEGEFVNLVAPDGKRFGFIRLNGQPITLTDPNKATFFVPKGKNLITYCLKNPPPPPPPPVQYLVTVLTNLNNTGVSPQYATLTAGQNFSAQITPPSGYKISSITVNGVSFTTFTETGYELNLTNIQQNTVVIVGFAAIVVVPTTVSITPTWTAGLHVTMTVNNQEIGIGSGGTYTVAKNVQIKFKIQVFLSLNPDGTLSGHYWDKVVRNGTTAALTQNFSGGFAYYEFNNGNLNQTVDFYALPYQGPATYLAEIVTTGTGQASVNPARTSIYGGANFSGSVTPQAGSYIQRAWIERVGFNETLTLPTNGGSFTIVSNTNTNTRVVVQVEAVTYTVEVSAETGGYFLNTPAVSTVRAGTNWSTLVVPDAGYEIDKIMMGTEERAITNRAGEAIEINGINRNYSFRATFRVKTNKLRIYVEIQHDPAEGALDTKLQSVNPLPPYIEVDPNTPFTLSGRTMNGWEFSSIMLNGTYIVGALHIAQFSYTIAAEQMTIDYYLVLQIKRLAIGF